MIESLVAATRSDPHRIAQVLYATRPGHAMLEFNPVATDSTVPVYHQLWTRLDEVDPIWQADADTAEHTR